MTTNYFIAIFGALFASSLIGGFIYFAWRWLQWVFLYTWWLPIYLLPFWATCIYYLSEATSSLPDDFPVVVVASVVVLVGTYFHRKTVEERSSYFIDLSLMGAASASSWVIGRTFGSIFSANTRIFPNKFDLMIITICSAGSLVYPALTALALTLWKSWRSRPKFELPETQ